MNSPSAAFATTRCSRRRDGSIPRWREGDLDRLHRAGIPGGFRLRAPSGELALRLAAVAAAIDEGLEARKGRICGQMSGVRLVDDARLPYSSADAA